MVDKVRFFVDPKTNSGNPDIRMAYGLNVVPPWTETFPWMADINQDGRPDVVLAPTEYKGGLYRISWVEAPDDPKSGGWSEQIIDSPVETVVHSLGVADMDSDGDLDVVTAEMHQGNDPDEVRVHKNSYRVRVKNY